MTMRHLALAMGFAWVGCSGADTPSNEFATPLRAVEQLRIGSVDDPTLVFTWFNDLEVGPDGTIYTLHPQENAIRVHGPDGRFIRTIGRTGEGPGEFARLGVMGMLGDTLWTLDRGTYRFSYFDLSGELLGTRPAPIRLGETPDERPPRAEGLFSDGTIRGAAPAFSHLVATGAIRSQTILRLDSDGVVLDTITSYSVENTVWQVANPDDPRMFASFRAQPFSDTEIVEVSDYAQRVVRVDRRVSGGDRPVFTVAVVDFDGDTLFARSFDYTPVPLPDSLAEARVETFAASFEDMSFPGAPTPARAAAIAREGLYRPPVLPPVRSVMVGRDNSVWLRAPAIGGRPRTWYILAPDGEPHGSVELPSRFTPRLVEVGAVWGMERDDLDVPYIVHYAIARVEEESE